MELDKEPQNYPQACGQLIYNKGGKNIQEQKVSPINSAGKLERYM